MSPDSDGQGPVGPDSVTEPFEDRSVSCFNILNYNSVSEIQALCWFVRTDTMQRNTSSNMIYVSYGRLDSSAVISFTFGASLCIRYA